MSLRIIGGIWRSRRLVRPITEDTRPVPDRVKQAVFDILGSRYGTPGGLPELRVADVFAGSGSMGLEALSRGAQTCRFYERTAEALRALRRNIEDLGATSRCLVVPGDAWSAAARDGSGAFDLIFLDPPYLDSADSSPQGSVPRFLRRIATGDSTESQSQVLLVLHHSSKTRFVGDNDGWSVLDERKIGSNAVTIFAR